MLSMDVARAIVNKIMNILGKNINIMDDRGVIIASGEALRVGAYHEGAAHAVRINKSIEIDESDMNYMEGVRTGVNVPVYFGGNVVGVVGITGNPDEVRDYAQLVRFTAELMIEQAELQENIYRKERAAEIYFQNLLDGKWGKDIDLFIKEGNYLGFDLDIPRVAIVLDLSKYDVFLKGQGEFTTQEFVFQDKIDDMLKKIKNYFYDKSDIVVYKGAGVFVILKSVNIEDSKENQYEEIYKMADQVEKIIVNYIDCDVIIGIGNYHPGIEGLRRSYIEGLEVIKLIQLFNLNKNKGFFEDLQLEYLITKIPVNFRKDFYMKNLKRLIDVNDLDKSIEYKEELLESLNVYFEENLNVKSASERLYIHRNTLMHRLKKVHSATGKDPTKFMNAFYLKLALLFYCADKEF